MYINIYVFLCPSFFLISSLSRLRLIFLKFFCHTLNVSQFFVSQWREIVSRHHVVRVIGRLLLYSLSFEKKICVNNLFEELEQNIKDRSLVFSS